MKRFFFILSFFICFPLHAQDGSSFFPDIEGFRKSITPEVYTPETLFELIDGAADMFLTYDFEELVLAEYSNEQIQYIRVEVYKHSNEANAYGAYAQERNPDAHFVQLGCEGYHLDGAVNFCSGPYYVKLVTNDRGDEVQKALMLIAERVAKTFPPASKPRLFSLFPQEQRKHHAEYYVNRDFMGYAVFQRAYVVPYNHSELFLLAYPTHEQARNAIEKYANTIKANQTFERCTQVQDPNEGKMLLQQVGKYILGARALRDEQKARAALTAMAKTLRSIKEQ